MGMYGTREPLVKISALFSEFYAGKTIGKAKIFSNQWE